MKKIPFEVSKKQRKNIELIRCGLIKISPRQYQKIHTGEIFKAYRRKGKQFNTENIYGKQRDCVQFIKLNKGEK